MSQKAENILLRDYQDPPEVLKKEEREPITSLTQIVELKPRIRDVREYYKGVLDKINALEAEEFT
jgi:hypothetical protein